MSEQREQRILELKGMHYDVLRRIELGQQMLRQINQEIATLEMPPPADEKVEGAERPPDPEKKGGAI